jgi:hypothetical protein
MADGTQSTKHGESQIQKFKQENGVSYFNYSQGKNLRFVMFMSELSQRHLPAI